MQQNAPDTDESWDPDYIPDLGEVFFERAAILHGDKIIREATGTLQRVNGRPRLANPKQLVSLRLDAVLLDKLRASGPGWQSRVNAMLRAAVGV